MELRRFALAPVGLGGAGPVEAGSAGLAGGAVTTGGAATGGAGRAGGAGAEGGAGLGGGAGAEGGAGLGGWAGAAGAGLAGGGGGEADRATSLEGELGCAGGFESLSAGSTLTLLKLFDFTLSLRVERDFTGALLTLLVGFLSVPLPS